MAEMQLVLNEEEQRVLVDLLTSASKQHPVEEHRRVLQCIVPISSTRRS
jgi:hypothetical protein